MIEGEPDSIEGRLNKNNIPFYFDRVGGLHAKCNDGELWTFLSGQPSTFDSSKKLIKDVSDEYLVVSDIAVNLVPKTSAVKVNKIIEDLGLQKKEGKCWVATTSGEEYSRVFESEKQGFSNKSFMKWKFEVITIIQDYIDSK